MHLLLNFHLSAVELKLKVSSKIKSLISTNIRGKRQQKWCPSGLYSDGKRNHLGRQQIQLKYFFFFCIYKIA